MFIIYHVIKFKIPSPSSH